MLALMTIRVLALLFAATIAASAQSQPPAPRGGNTNRTAQNQTGNQREQAPVVPAATQPPISLNVSVAPSVITNGPRGDQDGDSDSTSADWWMVGLTFLGLVATVVLVVIAMRQFATQTKQTNDALKLAADGLQATRDANTQSSTEAAKVEERSRTEMILAYPPRLAIRNVSIPLMGPLARGGKTKLRDLSDELTGEFLIANIGRNDAIIEAVYSQWIIGDLPMTNPCHGAIGDNMNVTLKAGTSIAVPARPGKINWGLEEDGSVTLEVEDDLTAVISRKKPVYLIGFVAYRDTLGGFRRTMFCRIFDYEIGRFKPFSDPDYNYKD